MSLISGLLENATEIDAHKLAEEFEPILVEGEQIERAFQIIRDLFVFTNWRLVLVDKQGVTGKKTEYHSIPYRSIIRFSVETAGHFDRDSEMKIWLRGTSAPIERQFRRRTDIVGLQKALAHYVLKVKAE